jgi:hypothetical protein
MSFLHPSFVAKIITDIAKLTELPATRTSAARESILEGGSCLIGTPPNFLVRFLLI